MTLTSTFGGLKMVTRLAVRESALTAPVAEAALAPSCRLNWNEVGGVSGGGCGKNWMQWEEPVDRQNWFWTEPEVSQHHSVETPSGSPARGTPTDELKPPGPAVGQSNLY